MPAWRELFVPQMPLLEAVIRGTAVYLLVLALLRLVLKRNIGTLSVQDFLMIVLLGNASTSALTGGHRSITDGLIVGATVIVWNSVLEWLSTRVPALRRITQPPPVPLVKDGELLRRNLRRELVTEEELNSRIRQHGIEDVKDVRLAFVEPNGQISVIPRDESAGA